MVSTIEYILSLITKSATLELEIAPNRTQRDEDSTDVEDFTDAEDLSTALYFWR